MSTRPIRIEIDGRPATAETLRPAALANYGHFTAMQVRQRCVRGLDLHLRRLVSATAELFDVGVDADLIRDRIRHALRDTVDASVRVDIFHHEAIAIMVTIRPPAGPASTPQQLMSVQYQRPAAHLKHAGTFGQLYYGRLAHRQGFDDALLTGPDGLISEAGISNIGFSDGMNVTWPDAPSLPGITMQLLQASLPAVGIPTRQAPVRLADLSRYTGAFVTNSISIAPVSRIDDVKVPVDNSLVRTLTETYDAVPWDRV